MEDTSPANPKNPGINVRILVRRPKSDAPLNADNLKEGEDSLAEVVHSTDYNSIEDI